MHFELVSGKFFTFFDESKQIINCWRECCLIIREKKCPGIFIFFASFKRYDYFSAENACFNKIHKFNCMSKTNQTIRQVIKISRHGVLEKCQEGIVMLIMSSC